MAAEKSNETKTIEDVVKGLVLIPDYELAKEYIARHRQVLFSDEARIIFLGLIASQEGEFKTQLQKVEHLLDECKTIGIEKMIKMKRSRETKID